MARSSQLRATAWIDYHPERTERQTTALDAVRGRAMKAKRQPAEVRVPDSFESPESSTIGGGSYDSETQTLSVMFIRKGDVRERYDHVGIPPQLWAEFVMAESKGQFYNARIRPLYKGTKIVRK